MKNINTITVSNSAFNNSKVLTRVDLEYVPWSYNSMANAFNNCTNLIEITNINNNVTNMTNCFVRCSNLSNVPTIPNSVRYMNYAFSGCQSINSDIYIYSNNISESRDCFYNTGTHRKYIHIPFFYSNGYNSATYNSFSKNYSSSSVSSYSYNCLLRDIEDTTDYFNDWGYTKNYARNTYILVNYFGSNTGFLTIPNQGTELSSALFSKTDKTISSYDLAQTAFVDNSMYDVFYNCQNLTGITNINENVTNMSWCFDRCINLVNAPTIPNSVIDMSYTFSNCSNLVNAPTIPDSVTDLTGIFNNCSKLQNVPTLSRSATRFAFTFNECSSITHVPNIPNTVSNMYMTFANCLNLTGSIYIESENIYNAYYCFNGTSLNKDVYIPFTYANNYNTVTYNSFINARYSPTSRVNGVLLKDINNL